LVGICCSFAHFMSLPRPPLFSLLFSSHFVSSSALLSFLAAQFNRLYQICFTLSALLLTSAYLCYSASILTAPIVPSSYVLFPPPSTLGSPSSAHLRSPPTCMNYDLKSPAGHSARLPSTMHLQLSSLTTFLILALTASRS
jgi:hypothetical protein